jgi:UDP-N-acetylglucosamine 4,6-dehydratase
MSKLNNASILITGGTGSLGKSLIQYLLANTSVRRIAIYSRDELKQSNLRQELGDDPRLRWFIGDIRDLDRLKRALHKIEFVIHAAALKQVDTGEYNPMEFIKTNVLGSQNVIDACIETGVKRVVALSTDKASSPINLYGATKLTADKLFIAANNYSAGYRGSVIPYFQKLVESKRPIPITDMRMTRFWISLDAAVRFVIDSLESMDGGELYVPKIPSMKIIDLARAISPQTELIEIGMRPGEKLHEEMISADDSRRTYDLGARYVVTPVVAEWGFQTPKGLIMEEGHAYRSDTNSDWISQDQISDAILRMNNL